MNTNTPASRGGIFPRLWAALFGSDAARLKERLQPAHWLSYVLIIAQSATVLLVFGHAEIPLLVSRDWGVQVIAALAVFVLLASVFAADMAMLATLKRIPALARNRQGWQLREHVAYTVFVLATEAITLAVVLAALDAAPDALTAATPLIAPGSAVFTAAIVLRVLLVSWSAVQLVIVRGRLPVLLSTLTATGREIVGAHVERKLAALSLDDLSLPAAFRTYAAMSKPPRRVRTVWNGWLTRRELAAEAEEARQVQSVVDALDELEVRSQSQSQSQSQHPALPAPILPPASAPATAHATASPQGAEGTMGVDSHLALASPASAPTDAQMSAESAPERPPTGPGSPAVQKRPARRGVRTRRTKRTAPAILRLEPVPAEERIRAVLETDPTASINRIAREAGVGKSTASKWREVWLTEMGQQRASASQQIAQ